MKSSFKRNLLIGFGVSLLLLIVSSLASYTSISNLLNSEAQVRHTNLVISSLEKVISALKDAETGQRGFLLTNREKFLEPYNGANDSAIRVIRSVEQLTRDNAEQQKDIGILSDVVRNRLNILKELIERRKAKQEIAIEDFEKGKLYMDQARSIVNRMEDREQYLLQQRSARMETFTTSTPVLIITAALLSLLITVIFFLRVNNDFESKVKLQNELEEKDRTITRRINVIQSLADTIAKGNYSTRVSDNEKDVLGSLAGALNKMAESLDYSFNTLSAKEALQTGIAGLNEEMLGEKDIKTLTTSIVDFVAKYTNSHTGAFYVLNHKNLLEFSSGYAVDVPEERKKIAVGHGLVGQSAANGKRLLLKDIDSQDLLISFASGSIKPRYVVAFPVFFENKVSGVIELASLQEYTANDFAFLDAVSLNAGIVLNTAENRQKLQELLEETQAQTEELQSQHTELENLNAELEAQAEKLQTSEEELKVQQEELLQTNKELEVKSASLEEKNQLIVERNLEIQKKAEQLELSTKYKSEFLANMSHELRTPLNSILLLSRLLAENSNRNLNSDQVEYANVIRNSGNSLLSLIDEILDLSRIESGKMQLEYSETPVASLLAEMRSLFGPLFREKNIELRIEEAANLPASIETDKMRLEQILKNLLSNALKFTSKGYVSLAITPAGDSDIRFSVKDTGIGIPKEKQQLIFEAFQQADGSTRRKFGGTGLGLSISRELAKLLGGGIELISEPGRGSEFSVTIPRSRQKKERKQVAGTETRSLKNPDGNGRLSDVRSFTSSVIPVNIPDDRDAIHPEDKVLLVIEDDINFAKSLLDFARQKGYKGVVAVRGDEGVTLARQLKPAGILLDIQLPVKSGWDVMEELKADHTTRNIPVHIMSAYEMRKESLSKGAIDFINKPLAFDQMQDVFKRIEYVLSREPGKVLIVEDNAVHAKALAFFLQSFNVTVEIRHTAAEGVVAIQRKDVDCVILDIGIPDNLDYDSLEQIRRNPGFVNIPVIVFTGKSLSQSEEIRIKQYADSIVIKTAHSYQRLLDEVSLFLHLMEGEKNRQALTQYRKTGQLTEVLKNKTVLIADDDARNIFSLTGTLEQLGMNVLTAIDGKDALLQLEQHPETDVVLMDMMMPEMDGYATIARIRKNPAYKRLPVLAVTAKAMSGDREKCIQAGASDYISKPVDVDQLLSLLRVWLYGK